MTRGSMMGSEYELREEEPLPMELRMFSHNQFEADEYVQGVCREVGTGAQMRMQLEKLRDLRGKAQDILMQGAREQAASYVSATARIRETGQALAELGNQALTLETCLEELDHALNVDSNTIKPESKPEPKKAFRRTASFKKKEVKPAPEEIEDNRKASSFSRHNSAESQQESHYAPFSSLGHQEPYDSHIQQLPQELQQVPFSVVPQQKPHLSQRSLESTIGDQSSFQSSRSRADDDSDSSSLNENTEKRGLTVSSRHKKIEDEATELETRVTSVDAFVRSGQTAHAVATWIHAKREMRRLKRRLERHGNSMTEDIEALNSRLEARQRPLVSLVETGAFNKHPDRQYAQLCFGFGTSLHDTSSILSTIDKDASFTTKAKLIVPAEGLFDEPEDERIERARHAMIHALGNTNRSRQLRFNSYANAVKRVISEPKKFWTGLAFVLADLWILFSDQKDSKPPVSGSAKKTHKQNDKLEFLLIEFCSKLVNDLVATLAALHFEEDALSVKAITKNANVLVKEARSGIEVYDRLGLVNEFPPLKATALLVTAITPLISLALEPYRLSPDEFRSTLNIIWPPLKSRIEELDDEL